MEESSPIIIEENTEDPEVKIIDGADTKNKKKRTSEAWNHFTEETRKDGKSCVKCIHCGREYVYEASNYGTSTLNRHLDKCKKKPKYGDILTMHLDHEGKLKARNKIIDPKTCRDWMTKISVAHDLPLNWVEYDMMRGFLNYLNPDMKFISRNTHASDVVDMYKYEKEKLKLILKNTPGMVCLTSDLWTACTNMGYICLTAHYVDEKWKLNNKILVFCSMPPPHTGAELAQKVYDCLVEWEIDRKVFSLTLDNATANNSMVQTLRTRLNLQNSLLCNGEHFHIKCCAHILNLIVQDGLKVADGALHKIRGTIICKSMNSTDE